MVIVSVVMVIVSVVMVIVSVVMVTVFRSDQKNVQQKYEELLEGHLAATKKRIQVVLCVVCCVWL